jgi:hypothetical protein
MTSAGALDGISGANSYAIIIIIIMRYNECGT